MTLLAPGFLWLLLVLLLMMLYRQQKREYFISKESKHKLVLLYLSLMMMILALARPVLEEAPIKQEYEGSEVVVAIDLSYSMQAQDIEPNRFEASKFFVKELIKKRIHERFALLGFTTNAIILSPLSSDAELLSHQLDLIRPELVITKGTNMASVLELSTRLSQVKEKNLIIVGDGGDDKDFSEEISYAKEKGLSISMVMMATASGARLQDRNGAWIKDSADHLVISSANTRSQLLPSNTDGIYIQAGGNAVEEISSWLDTREKKLSSTDLLMYKELFYYPLFVALFLFMSGVTRVHKYLFKGLVVVLAFAGLNLQADMREFSTQSAGDEAYAEERYLKELEFYKSKAFRSPEDHYNLGNAYYKAGKYEEAIDTYKEIRSTKPFLKAHIYHNLGNAYVRLEMFEEARQAYTKSLIIGYDKETDKNLLHIVGFVKHEGQQTGQQKGEKRNESKMAENSSKKEGEKKEGAGSSNMKVSAQAGAGSKTKGKKVENEGQVQFNASQSGLSYRQYELINERRVNEENPW